MEETEFKKCPKCGGIFPKTSEYFYRTNGKLQSACKKCDNARKQKWRIEVRAENGERLDNMKASAKRSYEKRKDKHLDWARKYSAAHREQYRESNKRYSETHKAEKAALTKEWWEKQTPEEREQRKKQYYQNSKEYIRQYEREHSKERYAWKKKWIKERKEKDPDFAFRESVRQAIYQAFTRRNQSKAECGAKTLEIIGCSYSELKEHLKKTFKANYGYDYDGSEKVHIDHIVPLATAETREDVIRLCHYTNLQLLKPSDNTSKGARLDYPLRGI